MQTRCPHCQTIFRVSETQLSAAQGRVRCGKCQQVFNAKEHFSAPTDEPNPLAAKKTPPPAPPQIDWLQQDNEDVFEHIDLGESTADTADIEISEPVSDDNHEQLIAEIPATDHREAEVEFTTDVDSFDSTVENADAAKEIQTTDLVPDETQHETESDTTSAEDHNTASEDSLIPGGFNESLQEIENDLKLPGIEPAYEPDNYLNAREEQGLDDLQGEIHRQLQAPQEKHDNNDAEADTYDSALDFIEDVVEQPAAKTTAFEKIELSAIPEDSGNAVNWDDAVHHDTEVPIALRSSMQALQEKKRRHPLLTAFMALVLFVLIADLGIQAIVFRSFDIATAWPQTRELLTTACHYLPCVYSGRREPRKIQLVSRDVRVHPKAKHALLISATLVNQAGYPQPYPRLAVKLSDLSGDVVAEREFAPQDYLKASESQLKLLRPDIPTLITLEVLDPGSEAVNFEFRFL